MRWNEIKADNNQEQLATAGLNLLHSYLNEIRNTKTKTEMKCDRYKIQCKTWDI